MGVGGEGGGFAPPVGACLVYTFSSSRQRLLRWRCAAFVPSWFLQSPLRVRAAGARPSGLLFFSPSNMVRGLPARVIECACVGGWVGRVCPFFYYLRLASAARVFVLFDV